MATPPETVFSSLLRNKEEGEKENTLNTLKRPAEQKAPPQQTTGFSVLLRNKEERQRSTPDVLSQPAVQTAALLQPPAVAKPAAGPKPTPMPAGLDYGADVDLMGVGESPFSMGRGSEEGEGRTYITVPEVVKDASAIKDITDYMVNRLGDEGKRKPQETVKDYVNRFRSFSTKGSVGIGTELNWIVNQPKEVKQQAGKAYAIAQKLGSTFNDELLTALDPTQSPETYYSLGAGFFVRKAVERNAKAFLYRKAIGTAAGVGIEGGVAAVSNLAQQDTLIEAEMQKERDYTQTAVAVGLSSVMGAIEGRSMVSIKDKGLTSAQKTKAFLERRAEEKGIDVSVPSQTEQAFREAFEKKANEELNEKIKQPLFNDTVDKEAARSSSLGEMAPDTDLTTPILNKKVIGDVFNIAKEILVEMPELRNSFDLKTERVTSIVSKIVSEVPNLDVDVLDRALSRAGVTPQDFSEAIKVSLSDAGVYLNKASQFAKFLKGLGNVDPEFDKMVNRLVKGGADSGADLTAVVSNGLLRAGKETRALAVSATSTAINNAAGSAAYLSLKVAGDIFIDTVVFAPAKLIKDMTGGFRGKTIMDPADMLGDSLHLSMRMSLAGAAAKKSLKESWTNIKSDADVFKWIANSGVAAEITDKMLANNPRLRRIISNVGVDADRSDISRVAQLANVFNQVADVAVRRPIFVASVYKQLREIGLDADEFLIRNKPIPVEVLNKAVKETLEATFSLKPEKSKKPITEQGFSSVAGNLGHDLVTIAEKTPVLGDLLAPFARFTANAIAYQYKATPFNSIGAASTFSKALKESDPLKRAVLLAEAKKNFAISTAGTAAIAWAYGYRNDNRDIAFNEMRQKQTGSVADVTTKFPIVNFLAAGEVVRWLADTFYSPVEDDLLLSPADRDKKIKEYRAKATSLVFSEGERAEFKDKADLLDSDSVRPLDMPKLFEVITGYGRTGGTPITIMDALASAWADPESRSAKKIKESVAETMGTWVGRVKGPFKPIIDLYNSVTEGGTVLRDTKTGEEGFLPQVMRSAVAGIEPAERALGMQPRQSALQEGPMRRGGSYIKELTGAMPGNARTKIETELMRQDLPVYSLYGYSGNRELDNLTKQVGAKRLVSHISRVINTKRYAQASKGMQKILLQSAIQASTKETREQAKTMFSENNYMKLVEMQWSGLPAAEREAMRSLARLEGVGTETAKEKEYLMDNYSMLLDRTKKEGKLFIR